jgi:hypothetical protein
MQAASLSHFACQCSALRDRRFEPVAHRELASLSCTVSLLFAFETASSWLDWTIGTHGLIIDFYGAHLTTLHAGFTHYINHIWHPLDNLQCYCCLCMPACILVL